MIPLKKRDIVDSGSSSGFKEIQPAEVSIIKHYLSTICPSDLYQKFGFNDFFELKMARKGNYIFRDPDNSKASMVLRCINCLIDQRTEKTDRLLDYAYSAVIENVKSTPLVTSFNAPDANRHLALFSPSTKLAAKDLFTKDTTQQEAIRAYILLDTILKKDKPITEESKEANEGA
ncbi:hypothetical protein FOXYS1_13435 [Fusarium oxysporum]|uniref:Uncharacterized protein n=1 Tax=Fusarium oxysporum TaxID=5507 RepID=A0A8H5A265_FUSOX|nr:hypothetical protein FOXYS1_13435 [Fusarium oxysporum]